jgi:UDP-N-acetyl-D-glucosamine dehydrogenase
MKIGIVGLGYVGLPLAVAFAEAGHEAVGVDLDGRKIEAVVAGISYIEDVEDRRLAACRDLLVATTDVAALAAADAICVCVPTPLTVNREPDLRPLVAAGEALATIVRPGQTIILESTTFPGTTRDFFGPLLERTGLTAGVDFHLAFSPERVDPGRTDFTLRTTPKVLGGLTEACGDAAEAVYRAVCDEIIRVSTAEAAELTKLLENIFRVVNIAMVNEMSMLCDRMGIDIWEVVDAAATKPYGFMRFDPGPGMGGHCLPVDPFYLSWRARQFDMSTEFVELAGKVNQNMPYYCVQRVVGALNGAGRSVNGSRIVMLGVSYKPGIGDTRESPALKMVGLLQELGADVVYHDPYVPVLPAYGLAHTELADALIGADVAAIATAHPDTDHQAVVDSGLLTVDLRGVVRGGAVGRGAPSSRVREPVARSDGP